MLWNFALDGRTMIVPDEPEKRALLGTWGSNHLRRTPRLRQVCRWTVRRADGKLLLGDTDHCTVRSRQFARKGDASAYITRQAHRHHESAHAYALTRFTPKPKHIAGWRRRKERQISAPRVATKGKL